MDVRKWLEQVDDGKDSRDGEAAQQHLKHSEHVKRANVSMEERKRHNTDSSLLDVQPQQQEPSRQRRASTVNSVNGCESEHDPTHTSATGSELPDQPYARRPRRKTRPDRYDPYPKEGRDAEKAAHRSKKVKSGRSKRKTKHKKDEKPGSGIAQNFHAKNVSGARLTLKPRETLGLFNKGKTSTVVKGRGLPDLVFSEMRFLQKSDEEGTANVQVDVTKPKKKRKSDHIRDREGEISSYFATPRPPLAEKDQISRESQIRTSSRLPEPHLYQAEQSPALDKPIPTIEVVGKRDFLDRGMGTPPRRTTSYVSWSDSTRGCSRISSQWHARTFRAVCHAANARPSQDPNVRDRSKLKHELPKCEKQARREANTLGDRFVVSALDSSTDSIRRTQSSPAKTSSPHKHEDTKKTCSAAADIYRSSLPMTTTTGTAKSRAEPGTFVNRQIAVEPERDDLRRPNSTTYDPDAEEGNKPHGHHSQSSHGLERAIWHCDLTIPRPGRAGPRDAPPNVSSGIAPRECMRPTTCITSHRYGDRNCGVCFGASTVLHHNARNFGAPGIYKQQEHDFIQAPFQSVDIDSDALYQHYLFNQRLYDEDATLEHGNEEGEENPEGEEDPADFEEDVLDSIIHPAGDEAEFDNGQTYMSDVVVRPIQSNNGATASAFWRPNRLY